MNPRSNFKVGRLVNIIKPPNVDNIISITINRWSRNSPKGNFKYSSRAKILIFNNVGGSPWEGSIVKKRLARKKCHSGKTPSIFKKWIAAFSSPFLCKLWLGYTLLEFTVMIPYTQHCAFWRVCSKVLYQLVEHSPFPAGCTTRHPLLCPSPMVS